MERVYIYAGSFDPPTNGHLDVIRQAMRLADKLIVAVGRHATKAPLFSVDDRVGMLQEICSALPFAHGDVTHCTVEVMAFEGLVVDLAQRVGAQGLIRGLRSGTDFDSEMQMAAMNATLSPELQTIFIPSSAGVRGITATLVRQIARMGGDVSAFVPPIVQIQLAAELSTH
jgi:pantetheine-phosphate adenylyltransferase